MGIPNWLAGWFISKPATQMDDDWGYPNFRKPPNNPNTSDFQILAKNTVNHLGLSGVPWKAQVWDLCDIAHVILNPTIPKP